MMVKLHHGPSPTLAANPNTGEHPAPVAVTHLRPGVATALQSGRKNMVVPPSLPTRLVQRGFRLRRLSKRIAPWLAASAVLAGGPARASEPAPDEMLVPAAMTDRYATPGLSFDVIGASNAPAGNVAWGLTFDAGRYFSLSAAVGVGVEGRFLHRRWAIAPRGRVVLSRALAIDAGLALSWAEADVAEESGSTTSGQRWSFRRYWETFYRLSPELGLTYRPTSRVSIRAFAGMGFPLGPSTCLYSEVGPDITGCDAPQIPPELIERHSRFPYLGVSVGQGLLPFGPKPADWGGFASAESGHWYGWQLLLADAATLVMVPLTLAARNPGDSYVPSYLVWGADVTAAITLHALHDHPLKALGSFALRVGLLAAGWRLGEGIGDYAHGRVWAVPLGWLMAALIDDLVLARD